MTTRPRSLPRILDAIACAPWAITPQHMEIILAIARGEMGEVDAAQDIKDARASAMGPYAGAEDDHSNQVAVIPIFGPIFPRADLFMRVSGATSTATISAHLTEAANDPNIMGIVLNIDSPGGQVTGIHELANQIRDVNQRKPVTAYVYGLGCSAAYWLASAAGRIVADRTATVGSIGVITTWVDDSEARKRSGMKEYEIISSQSPRKCLRPNTKDGRNAVQEQVDALADIFVGQVAAFRGVRRKTVLENFGQGGVFLGDAATRIGMIDETGSLETAIMSVSTGQHSLTTTQGGTGMSHNILRAVDDDEDKDAKTPTGRRAETTDDDDEEDKDAKKAKAKKASDDGDDDDENAKGKSAEEDDEDKDAKKNGKASPKAVYQQGAADERRRLLAIDALNIRGHDALVARAKESGMTAEELSLQVLMAERSKEKEYIAAYERDATSIAGVPASPRSSGGGNNDSLVSAMVTGMRQKQGVK